MSHHNKSLLNGLAGAIVITATLVTFFVGFDGVPKQTIDYLALSFVLISEALFFGTILMFVALNNRANTLLLRSGILSALALYWMTTAIVAIFSTPFFRNNIRGFISVQIIIIVTVAIAVIGVFLAASSIKSKNDATFHAGAVLLDCENVIFPLLNHKVSQKIASPLNRLYEELKFSDKSTCLPEQEQEIRLKVIELSNSVKSNVFAENVDDTIGQIDNLILLIKKRNMAVKQQKRGGY